MAAAIGPDTAAVLVEPIQGEAGIRVPPPGYLRDVRELTRQAGVLLIVDEIQSGMGRTGRFLAHQHDEIRPDVVTMAKALGSGYPIGATIARTEVADTMQRGDHGTTFGGNPVACTAALATLDVIEPLLGGHVEKVSTRLADGLQELRGRLTGRSTWAPPTADDPDEGLPGAEVRGAGLWFALDLGHEAPARFSGAPLRGSPDPSVARQAALAALGRGLVVNPVTDTALRLAPPLVVTEEEIDEGLARLGAALEEAGLCR
jgi:acetylornithine/succinyldiaminopimelate/putrescine aminotransferase